MKIKYFAWIKERLEKSEEILNIEKIEISSLLHQLSKKGQQYKDVFSKPEKLCIAVNEELVNLTQSPELIITNNDEVAFFPPISGG